MTLAGLDPSYLRTNRSDSLPTEETISQLNASKVRLTSAGSQTDLTLPIGKREKVSALHNLPPEIWTPWVRTVGERIRQLNFNLVSNSVIRGSGLPGYGDDHILDRHPRAIKVIPPSPLDLQIEYTPSGQHSSDGLAIRSSPSSASSSPYHVAKAARSRSNLSSSNLSHRRPDSRSTISSGGDRSVGYTRYLSQSQETLLSDNSYNSIAYSIGNSPSFNTVELCNNASASPSSAANTSIKKVLRVPSKTEIKMYEKTLDKLLEQKTLPNLSQQEVSVLTLLLLSSDEEILIKSSSVITSACSFSSNIDAIIDSGCTLILTELLDHSSESVVISVVQAIANIAFSSRGQELMPEVIPILVTKLVKASSLGISYTQIDLILMALGNFAMRNENHEAMIHAIPSLMTWLSSASPNLRLRSLKLLNNLSTNSSMIPYLLASKAPAKLYALLSDKADREVLVRLVTFLANVVEAVASYGITGDSLPIDFKAPSPETLYSALYGAETSELFLTRLNNLSSLAHSDQDIAMQLSRINRKYLQRIASHKVKNPRPPVVTN